MLLSERHRLLQKHKKDYRKGPISQREIAPLWTKDDPVPLLLITSSLTFTPCILCSSTRMTIDSTSKASHSILSPQQSLELANVCLESAHTAKDIELVAELCHDADTVLSEAKNSLRGVHASKKTDNQSLHGIAAAYCELGDLWDSLGEIDKAHASYSKAEKLG